MRQQIKRTTMSYVQLTNAALDCISLALSDIEQQQSSLEDLVNKADILEDYERLETITKRYAKLKKRAKAASRQINRIASKHEARLPQKKKVNNNASSNNRSRPVSPCQRFVKHYMGASQTC